MSRSLRFVIGLVCVALAMTTEHRADWQPQRCGRTGRSRTVCRRVATRMARRTRARRKDSPG